MIDLVVFGDSVSLPHRSYREKVSLTSTTLEETWPDKILTFGTIKSYWNRAQGGHLSPQTAKEIEKLSAYLPRNSVLISAIQVGIGDATPRPYPLSLDWFGRKVGWLLTRLTSKNLLLRNRVLLKLWGRPWVSSRKYEQIMLGASQSALKFSKKVFLIPIAQPGPNLLDLVGPFSVDSYNSALLRITQSDDRIEFINYEPELHPDGHHLTPLGHLHLAEKIKQQLS